MDHMSGLHRFFWQEKVSLGNFWDTPHKKELDEQSFDSNRYSYLDWQVYQKLRIGAGPTKATDGHKVINAWRNDARSYWEEDGIQILSPTPELVADCEESGDYNNCSYVLKISHAGREIILPGDAEGPVWASILEHYDASDISCDILKAAHHGRQSGYHKDAVETMDPKVVICSVGKKPSTDAAAEYSKVADSVLSTRYYGTITATIRDDGDIWINDRNGEQIAVVDS
jgi:beta-lactamase superfamily II metal-dependent hydrolase